MTFLEAYAASMPAGMPKAPMWWCLILTCRGCSQTVRLSTRRYEPLLRLLRYSSEGGPRLTKPFHPPAVLWRLEVSAGGHILATAGDRPTRLKITRCRSARRAPPTTLSNEPRTATGNAPAPVPAAAGAAARWSEACWASPSSTATNAAGRSWLRVPLKSARVASMRSRKGEAPIEQTL